MNRICTTSGVPRITSTNTAADRGKGARRLHPGQSQEQSERQALRESAS
jgi:hypothetical protein